MRSHLFAFLITTILGGFLIGFGCGPAATITNAGSISFTSVQNPTNTSGPFDGGAPLKFTITPPRFSDWRASMTSYMWDIDSDDTTTYPTFTVSRLHPSTNTYCTGDNGNTIPDGGKCCVVSVNNDAGQSIICTSPTPSANTETKTASVVVTYPLTQLPSKATVSQTYTVRIPPTLGVGMDGGTTNVCATTTVADPMDSTINTSIQLNTLPDALTKGVSQLKWQLGCKYEDENGTSSTGCDNPTTTTCTNLADSTCSAKTTSFDAAGKHLTTVTALDGDGNILSNSEGTQLICNIYFNVPAPLSDDYTLTSVAAGTFTGGGTGDPAYSISVDNYTFNSAMYLVVLTLNRQNATGGTSPYTYTWSSTVGTTAVDGQTLTINALPNQANTLTIQLIVTDANGQSTTVTKRIAISAS